MAQIAVAGKSEFTTGFQLIGVQKIFETQSFGDLQKAMSDPEVGVLVVEESIMEGMHPEDRRRIEGSVKPVVVVLSKEESSQSLRQSIIRAIGVDLWKEGQ